MSDDEAIKRSLRDAELMQAYPTLRFFAFGHLNDRLQAVSEPICVAAWHMADTLPRNAETSAGLRKLLEAKDCFVRSML